MKNEDLKIVFTQIVINQVAIQARQLQFAENEYQKGDYLKPIPSAFINSAVDDFTSIIKNSNAKKLREIIESLNL